MGFCLVTDLELESCDWFDEVVVGGTAAWALDLLGKLGEAQSNIGWIKKRVLALFTLHTRLAAGQRRKEVVIIHGANLMCAATPVGGTQTACHLIAANKTLEANGSQIERVVCLVFDLVCRGIGFQRREVERAVDERELVVHIELTKTQHTRYLARSMEGQA